MNFAEFTKNKNTIIAVIALVIVCGGSFLGARALSKGVETTQPTIPTTINTTQPTATPTTAAPTTTTTTAPESTTAPTSSTQGTITTFPVPTEPTTPTTTFPTTMPTTMPTTQFTLPSVQIPQGGSSSGGVLGQIGNGVLFENGLASYMYDPEGNFYFTNDDPWQRALGYNELYDASAGFVAIYIDTMRCKFEYADKDWMIQFWKGQYGFIFVGHEIGIYNKPKSRTAEHYDCATDEEAIYMSMTGYRNGVELYSREYAKYWWCTGFVPGKLEKFADRSELSLKARLTMKDHEMLLAFCGALKENGMVLGEDFTTSGLDVFVEW